MVNAPNSMTGFATRRGQGAGAAWVWEMRAVNGRGLDLRLRLPDGIDRLEAQVRAAVTAAVARGNITLGLRLERGPAAVAGRVNPVALEAALAGLAQVRAAAEARGLPLAPGTLAEVLSLRGVWEAEADGDDGDGAALSAALLADLSALIADFNAMRRAEGRALAVAIGARVDRIAQLTDAAADAAAARADDTAQAMRTALARVTGAVGEVGPDRVAQELALIAVKADVSEEIDRLRAHVAAARALLSATGPVGRKLDFLTQEFMREANTLCSKAGAAALTAIGLDLKATIDQMREQVANVE